MLAIKVLKKGDEGWAERGNSKEGTEFWKGLAHNTMEVAIIAECLGYSVLLTMGQQELIGIAKITVGPLKDK